MIIYLTHIICAVLLCITFPNNVCILATIYCLFLIPVVHQNIIFDIVEKKHPPINILLKYMLHMSIYENYAKRINLSFIWVMIYLWNEIMYLVDHGEKRLCKIDNILDENDKRIAHLYYDLYEDDTVNRFHQNLFDTNKLYLFDRTDSSKRISLGIKNYRRMIKDNKKPTLGYDYEKKYYNAALGRNIFIYNRNFILYFPCFLIFLCVGYVDFHEKITTMITFSIFFYELCGKSLLSRKYFYISSNIFIVGLLSVASMYIPINVINPVINA